MSIGFYFDEHLSRNVAEGVQQQGFEVVMAVDVGMEGKDDDTEHLPYATEHELVMVTFDEEFAKRTMHRTDHAGLIYPSPKLREDIGGLIRYLIKFAEIYSPELAKGRVIWYLPKS